MTADIPPVAPRSPASRSSASATPASGSVTSAVAAGRSAAQPAATPGRTGKSTGRKGKAAAAPAPAAPVTAEDVAGMRPEDLVAGPCALPDAPLEMPPQVIETGPRTARKTVSSPAAPSAGIGQ